MIALGLSTERQLQLPRIFYPAGPHGENLKRLPVSAPQHAPTAVPKISAFCRLLYRNSNSATYSGRYLRLTLWNVPTMPRLMRDQKPSIVFVWMAPTTYSFLECRIVSAGYSSHTRP